MNPALTALVWGLQKVPRRWLELLWRIAGVRAFAERFYPQRPEVFVLAKPLEGHRMRLHWRSRKGFVFGTWEPQVVEAIQRVVRPGQLAVDLGAHVGYFTLLLAKQVGPRGQVVAFEPNPDIFEILRENLAMNAYRNVALESMAVADRAGEVELRLSSRLPLDGVDSIVTDPPGPGPRIRVLAVRLDDYFALGSGSVGFVKIDIEGAEALALAGMSGILKEDRPTLVIELHGVDCCAEKHPAFQKLKEAGYEVTVLGVLSYSRAHILAKPGHSDC